MSTRKNLRTNLTSMQNNLHSHHFTEKECKLYLNFLLGQKELLNHVTNNTDGARRNEYDYKQQELIAFFKSGISSSDLGYSSFDSSSSSPQASPKPEVESKLNAVILENHELSEQVNQFCGQLNTKNRLIIELNEQMETLRRLNIKLDNEIKLSNDELKVKENLIRRLEENEAQLKNQLKSLADESSEIRKASSVKDELERTKMMNEIESRDEQIDGLNKSLSAMKVKLASNQLKFKETESKLNHQLSEMKISVKKEIDELKSQHGQNESEQARMMNEIKSRDEQIDGLNKALSAMKAKVKDAENKLSHQLSEMKVNVKKEIDEIKSHGQNEIKQSTDDELKLNDGYVRRRIAEIEKFKHQN